MSEPFWISGWDRSGFPLENGLMIKVCVQAKKPDKKEAFAVISAIPAALVAPELLEALGGVLVFIGTIISTWVMFK